jgi:hypothetical protein
MIKMSFTPYIQKWGHDYIPKKKKKKKKKEGKRILWSFN